MSARTAPAGQVRTDPVGLRLLTRNKKTKGSRRLVAIAACVVLVVGILVAILLEQVILAQSAFELSNLRERLTAEEARHEELLMEAAKLDNAARIERFARQSLGMMDPVPGNIHYVVADVRMGKGLEQAPAAGRPIAVQSGNVGPVTASGESYEASSP